MADGWRIFHRAVRRELCALVIQLGHRCSIARARVNKRRDEEEGTGEGLSRRCCESKNDDSREEPGGSNSRIAATMRYEDVECAEAPFDNDDDGDVVFKSSPPTTRGVPRGFEVDAMMMGMEDLGPLCI